MKAAIVFVSIFFLSPALATNPHRLNYPNSPTPRQPGPYVSGDYVALGNRVVLEKITISQDEVADFIEANPNETLIVGGNCVGPCDQVPEGEIVPINSLPPSGGEMETESTWSVATKNRPEFEFNSTERNNLFAEASKNEDPPLAFATLPAERTDTAKRQLTSFVETFSQPKDGLKLGTVAIAFPAAVAGSLLLLLLFSVAETLRRKRRGTGKRAASSKYKRLAVSLR